MHLHAHTCLQGCRAVRASALGGGGVEGDFGVCWGAGASHVAHRWRARRGHSGEGVFEGGVSLYEYVSVCPISVRLLRPPWHAHAPLPSPTALPRFNQELLSRWRDEEYEKRLAQGIPSAQNDTAETGEIGQVQEAADAAETYG